MIFFNKNFQVCGWCFGKRGRPWVFLLILSLTFYVGQSKGALRGAEVSDGESEGGRQWERPFRGAWWGRRQPGACWRTALERNVPERMDSAVSVSESMLKKDTLTGQY